MEMACLFPLEHTGKWLQVWAVLRNMTRRTDEFVSAIRVLRVADIYEDSVVIVCMGQFR